MDTSGFLADRAECGVKIIGSASLVRSKCDAEPLGGLFRHLPRLDHPRNVRIPKYSNTRNLRADLLQKLKSYAPRFRHDVRGQPRDVATRPREPRHKSVGDGLRSVSHDDRQRARRSHLFGTLGPPWRAYPTPRPAGGPAVAGTSRIGMPGRHKGPE